MFQWLAMECKILSPKRQIFSILTVLGLPVIEAELDAEE